ncbi:MAG: hypothetical protein ACM336_13515 [Acidobacteriota bacterium]
MSRLDDELRDAFRREDPGPEFTARVLRAAAAREPKQEAWWRLPKLRWALAASLAGLMLTIGGVEYRQRQQGEAAKERLLLAMRIAGTKLNLACEKVIYDKSDSAAGGGAAAGSAGNQAAPEPEPARR